jgi:cation:H+ antiporter
MLDALIWCLAGLVALVVGSELLLRGGAALAARLRIPPLIIGLTVVSIGTSTPELAVGIEAVLMGNGPLAVGNIAGTNTVNILLILGLSAAIHPLALRMQTLRLDLPMIVAASVVLMAMSWDGTLTRGEGYALIALAVGYTVAVVRATRRAGADIQAEFAEELGVDQGQFSAGAAALDAVLLASGIVVVVLGADWLVGAAVHLARIWGVSDAFIGLTIVAIGTSAPELVTTVISTLRGNRDIAIGNLLGSSVYNILVILGVTCVVAPAGVEVGPDLIGFDIPVMTAVALVCIPRSSAAAGR